MSCFSNVYQNRRVLVTGHTGFKGSWLSLWLSKLGANVVGVALPASSTPNHWDLIKPSIQSNVCDIRNLKGLQEIFNESLPEIVFHLAAQPIVRQSYEAPLETWSTNLMGTANLLEACRLTPSVRAIVLITTDKCYKNNEWCWGYRENDPLGGVDPYSASKAAAEVLAESYRNSFFQSHTSPLLATARAGNVIGGGDWSKNRLIPDIVRSLQNKTSLEIRYPYATRPWQHVLDSLSGYLILGEQLLMGNKKFSDAWNFGPDHIGNRSVIEILELLRIQWPNLDWHFTSDHSMHEASSLFLDSSKARTNLGWRPVWNLENSLYSTFSWYRSWLEYQEVITVSQLDAYIADAKKLNLSWTRKN